MITEIIKIQKRASCWPILRKLIRCFVKPSGALINNLTFEGYAIIIRMKTYIKKVLISV